MAYASCADTMGTEMSKQWFSGPPPTVGWWPASFTRDATALRWWNGKCWSYAARRTYSQADVAWNASHPASEGDGIEWQHRPKNWPARSKT